MYLAKAYFKAQQYDDAAALLKAHSRQRPNDPYLWYWLGEMELMTGNNIGLHRARAEYFGLNGAFNKAVKHLNYAIPLAEDNVMLALLHGRIAYFNNVGAALNAM